jgi:hypothetical protein
MLNVRCWLLDVFRFTALLPLAVSFACPLVWGAEVDLSKLPPPATNKIDFARDIRPILEENCLRCHGPEKPKDNFRLDNRAAALKGGDNGVDIIPGNSARSPLIQYVAYLVEDSEMPPVGKGNQLSPAQVSTLRAWIDQGLVWNNPAISNLLDFAFVPTLGDTSIGGHAQKFRELNWEPGGWNGGAEQLEFFKQLTPDTRLQLNGHASRDDYAVNLALDDTGLGFIHSGWQQYRKYFDDIGGYDPKLASPDRASGRDLHLDIGKAWVDVGIVVPNWPRLVLGYEYDYKQGREATLEWNNVGTNAATARNMGPASEQLHEQVHQLKADLDYDYKGFTLEDRFRGEFYRLSTSSTNAGNGPVALNVREGTTFFQGANTVRVEDKFTDWFFASAGYLYSKLNADSTFRLDAPSQLQSAVLPDISLEREENAVNVNARLGPVGGLTLSGGILADYSAQSGFGPGVFDQQIPMPLTNIFIPFSVASDYNETRVEENVAMHFAKIPYTSVFAEGRLIQDDIGQFDQFSSKEDLLNKAVFSQRTIFDSQESDARVGFDSSPWRFVSFNAQYRYNGDDSRYDSQKLIQPAPTAYPTFITHRDLNTHEFDARMVLHPAWFLSATLSYQYHDTAYDVTTRPYALSAQDVISPGGEVPSGTERGQTYSLDATLTPFRRLYFNASFSYGDSTITTAPDGPSVVPYRGATYTVLANSTYVMSQTTDVFLGYFFSAADYRQNNYAQGLPLGIEYQRHGAQVGISRRLGKAVSAKLQYRLDYYNEPSSGGANNYIAHSVYGTLSFKLR